MYDGKEAKKNKKNGQIIVKNFKKNEKFMKKFVPDCYDILEPMENLSKNRVI